MIAKYWIGSLFGSLLFCLAASWLVAQDSSLPKAAEIVERYDHALGGRDALMRHTSSTMRGAMEIHQGADVISVPFVYYAGAPYRRLESVALPNGAGVVLNGFDGETAWSFDPRPGPHTGAQVYFGDDRESQKRDADFYYPINELSWFKSMETVGIEDFEGRPCYRLHGINNWNKPNDHLYDRETGLLTAYDFGSDLGQIHEIFSGYKKVDGVLVPMKSTVKVKTKTGEWVVRQVVVYESVTFNDVDPAALVPPQPVRDLKAKPKSTPTS